jgi:hypothetical protein
MTSRFRFDRFDRFDRSAFGIRPSILRKAYAMLATTYETQIVCDNCGRVVTRTRADSATFERKAELLDPALPEVAPDGSALADDGDLLSEEAGGPVEVLVEHIAVCGRCAATP